MMLSSLHLPSLNIAPGMLALLLVSAGAVLAVAVLLIVAAVRRAGATEVTSVLWGGALVLAGAALTAVLTERPVGSIAGGDRRAIERQAADLTARAIAPGSALACLDAVAPAVAEACETAVFAKPEAVAAAVDYIDAKLSLLATSVVVAERDPGLVPLVERLRGGLESDRYGLVAHVLAARGCGGPDCADLKLLRDPTRVVANMTAHVFEARLGAHALAWQTGGATSTVASAASMPALPAIGNGSPSIEPSAATTSGTANAGRVDFPSAASIPPVSIMTPEPASAPAPPPAAESKPAPAKRSSPSRRQTVREHPPVPQPAPRRQAAPQRTAPQSTLAQQPQAPPQQITPPPETAAAPEPPQSSGLP